MTYKLTILPDNCLCNIFSYLGHKDYWNIAYFSSKTFNNICKHISYQFNDIEKYSFDFIYEYWPMIYTKKKTPTRFYFGENTTLFHPSYSPKNAHFKYLDESMKYIKNFKLIKSDSFYDSVQYSGQYSGVLSYNILNITFTEYHINLKQIIENMPYLESLTIKFQIQILNNLTFTSLPSTINILNLEGVKNINDTHMDIITNRLPNLTEFISQCSNISDLGVKYLKERCNILTKCILYGSTKISDIGMTYLGRIHTLRTIDLSLNKIITDNGIKTLVYQNPNLTHIFLEYMNIGYISVESMEKYLKHPMVINISYTHAATYIPLIKLQKKCRLVIHKKL
jgi:hypothetical protein